MCHIASGTHSCFVGCMMQILRIKSAADFMIVVLAVSSLGAFGEAMWFKDNRVCAKRLAEMFKFVFAMKWGPEGKALLLEWDQHRFQATNINADEVEVTNDGPKQIRNWLQFKQVSDHSARSSSTWPR